MTSEALDAYNAVHKSFAAPEDWNSSAWSPRLIIATGLTGLAVEAVMHDLALPDFRVARDPVELASQSASGLKGILGCSYSGRSAEVRDSLSYAKSRGESSALVSVEDDTAEVVIPFVPIPIAFRHLCFCAVLPVLLGQEVAIDTGASKLPLSLLKFLTSIRSTEITPIFVGCEGAEFRSRVLQAHYLEILHKPAFYVKYPQWTHDLMWAITRTPGANFAFVFEPPSFSLSDNRFEEVLSWTEQVGLPYFVLPSLKIEPGGQHISVLISSASAYYSLALEEGIDTVTELQFNTW